jgi:hypothetical protein
MGYRDPAIHQRQVQLRAAVNEHEFERVALAKYGAPYDDLPWVLRHSVDVEVYGWPQSRGPGRRFDYVVATWRRQCGWRSKRANEEKTIEEERQMAVEVRKRRSKRKVRARRFSGRRPEMMAGEEA